MRNSRWLLGAVGRSTQPWWKSVETVTPSKQVMFMKRVLFGFQVRRKQVKHIATARLSAEQWEQLVESSCLLQHILDEMKAATHDDGTPVFPPASMEKAERRSVEGFLELNHHGFHRYILPVLSSTAVLVRLTDLGVLQS